MPVVEKEVIRPGTYWYRDETTGKPRKLVVTPELIRYWHEQGNRMLGLGLTVPVPMEHDFSAHPMTPAEKLAGNMGWVKDYRIREIDGKDGKKVKDVLFSAVDIQDEEFAKKLPRTVRWTSPWINSFTDGEGREWKNVISHLALTTRPRIIDQQPFQSIAAALSMATPLADFKDAPAEGFCLSRAGRLFVGKKSHKLRPRYPMAFSLWGGGIPLADTVPPMGEDMPDEELPPDSPDAGDDTPDMSALADPTSDSPGDVKMEELLCDLLQALGVPMPDESNPQEFKRHLYEAVMSKIKELSSKGMGKDEFKPDQNQPTNQQPNASQPTNPLMPQVQQEQQPMFMSLEEINKLPDPMRGVALAMHAENQKIRVELEASKKVTDGLRDAKLKEANGARHSRVALLTKISPKLKPELEAMLKEPAMALSMGDGGAVVDPMAQTLAMLEKGLADMPRLLLTESAALAVQPHPQDADMLTDERADEIADSLARDMGCPPIKRTA